MMEEIEQLLAEPQARVDAIGGRTLEVFRDFLAQIPRGQQRHRP